MCEVSLSEIVEHLSKIILYVALATNQIGDVDKIQQLEIDNLNTNYVDDNVMSTYAKFQLLPFYVC